MLTNDLNIARARWRLEIEGAGGFCPCCDRWGKVYKLKLNKGLVRALYWMTVNGDEDGWVDVQRTAPRWILRGKTYSLLAHWGLIESKAERSGVWRPTARGRMFVQGFETAPSAVYVFDDKVLAVDSTNVSFTSCLGVDFNLAEILSDRFDTSDTKEVRA